MEELNNKLHIDILNFDDTRRRDWEKNRKPYSVLFELTPKCSMNCIHCYLKDHHIDNSLLSYEEIIGIIDILYDKGILFLTFTGGDVFTRPDFLDIYMYAKKKGFFVEIFTNGELMSDEAIECFSKYPPLLIDISLYGSNEKKYYEITGRKGAFERVINNCKKLNQANVRYSLKTPLLKQTVDELSEMRKIADELGVVFAYSFELIPTIDGDTSVIDYQLDYETMLSKEFADFDKLTEAEKNVALGRDYHEYAKNVEQLPLFICNVARNSFLIDYQGKMCPCMKLRHRGEKIDKNTFDKVWDDFAEFGKMKASKNYRCSTCKARYQCSVCPAEMDMLYGDFEYVDDRLCKVAFARFAYYDEGMSAKEAISILKQELRR